MRALFVFSITASIVSLNAIGPVHAGQATGNLPSFDAAPHATLGLPQDGGAFAWDWTSSSSALALPNALRFDDAVPGSAPAVLDDLSRISQASGTTLTITSYAPFEWDGRVNGGPLPGYRIRIESPSLGMQNPFDDRVAGWPDSFTPTLSVPHESHRSDVPLSSGSGIATSYRAIGRSGFVATPTLLSSVNPVGRNTPGLSLSRGFGNTAWSNPLSATLSPAAGSNSNAASPATAAPTIQPFDVTHPTGAPSLSSRPGAPYTIFLDFAGFSFNGTWGTDPSAPMPGDTPAYDIDGDPTTFNATERANIAQIWARVAQKYAPFSVNVTTVDPFVPGGTSGTDSDRQAWYDQQPQLMHTVIGGDGAWLGSPAGGVSYTGVTASYQYDPNANGGAGYGFHTDWIFPANLGAGSPSQPKFIGEASSHENGHGLSLNHQTDPGNPGGYSTNNGATGNGSVAPIMGSSYDAQRGVWRFGTASTGGTQNDPQIILSNANLTLVDDGIGHTQITATPLSLNGAAINFNAAKGVIEPASSSSPQPIGTANYTADFFSFTSIGGTLNVTLYNAGERLTPGTADPGGTLSSTFTLLNADGTSRASVSTNFSTTVNGYSAPSETLSQTLPAGLFYLEVASTGGQGSLSNYDPASHYYDMGDYFLTGVVPAPEPGSLLLGGMGAFMLFLRRRRTPPAR